MTNMIQHLVGKKLLTAAVAACGFAGLAAAPQQANAGFHIGFDIGARPAYQERTTQVWVEPVYQTVCDHVWVAPTYNTVTTRMWVPEHTEVRDVQRGFGPHGWVERTNVVVPGHYEDQPQQVVAVPGHYEDVQRQVLVTPGHWETRVDGVACAPTLDRVHIEFGGR